MNLIFFILTCIVIEILIAFIESKNKIKYKEKLNKGELLCFNQLSKLSEKQYIILFDIMIKVGEFTTQIDFIVISQYGIFVIEVKDHNGFIIADENKKMWKEYYHHKQSTELYNPMLQNNTHIFALSSLLNLEQSKFISIICFSKKENVKFNGKSNNVTPIIGIQDVVSEITKFNKIIITEDINNIKSKIVRNNITDKKIRQEHVKKINDKKLKRDKDIGNMICPECGNKLKVKNGKNGFFLGCSAYPKCMYSVDIDEAYSKSYNKNDSIEKINYRKSKRF